MLVGGDSSERPVSFETGKAMANALSPEKFAVTVFDVASPETLEKVTTDEAQGLGAKPRHACVPVEWNQLTTTLYTSGFDIVLPALHGGWGEDGTLQALLDVAGIPYVGSGARASVIGIDKQVCKAVMREHGVKSPRGRVARNLEEAEAIFAEISGPVVIKPNSGGSSVGVTLIRDRNGAAETLRAAVQSAFTDGGQALIEELIEGAEVTAAVLGAGAEARVLPLLEIVPASVDGFFDYQSKYTVGGAQHIIPPRFPEETLETIRNYALIVHRIAGARGVSRSDYIVTNSGEAYFLEINTLPGMTELSLVPDCARAAGIEFAELLELLITAAGTS